MSDVRRRCHTNVMYFLQPLPRGPRLSCPAVLPCAVRRLQMVRDALAQDAACFCPGRCSGRWARGRLESSTRRGGGDATVLTSQGRELSLGKFKQMAQEDRRRGSSLPIPIWPAAAGATPRPVGAPNKHTSRVPEKDGKVVEGGNLQKNRAASCSSSLTGTGRLLEAAGGVPPSGPAALLS